MFLAGCCYGIEIPAVRIIYAQGFSTAEVMVFQYGVGVVLLVVIVALFSRQKTPLKAMLKLCCVGVVAAGVSFSYYRALDLLPSATAVTLLFQTVWMGAVVQAVRDRKLPNITIVLSIIVVMAGTVLATGVLEGGTEGSSSLDPIGIFWGLMSAVFYTAFIVASSKTATELPATNRTFFTTLGSFLISFSLCPMFFTDTLVPHITDMRFIVPGVILGIVGILLPVFFIASSSPHLPNGLSTIMVSSELPSGILCAVLLMGDTVSFLVVLGVVIILAGIVLSQSADLRTYFAAGRTSKH